MFLYRVKVEELDAVRLVSLRDDLTRGEESLRAHCPIREMSVVTEDQDELDIYLALDDFIDSEQLRRLVGELNVLLGDDAKASRKPRPRVSSELIHI
ncbi:MAG TPA: hypothetical protein VNU97_02875 [Rhizomicrobium sp.]|jgi:hypothetical protein|nr:hypothetical protein [Rhizomicrobium sp.]